MLSKANNSPKSTKRESADIIHTEETCSMCSEMHKIKEYKCYLQHALEERGKIQLQEESSLENKKNSRLESSKL